ncbi:CYTH domain-containing protein [Alteribacillus sp. YIM 98480]|uniref:CYTH domain-containing protein n=1 Tax=Alteribacillus sp. YIM 98480 TaxID=2606599 RepID=UPI00131B739A|nr:CYTH domain-containing protein [Alteribacillus sp. YIM 98480]
MAQENEIEKKNLLTEAEFQTLCKAFNVNDEDFFWQANTYFDTSDYELKNKGAALRIREKNSQFELTLKQPAKEGLLETNQPLTKKEAVEAFTFSRLPAGEVKTQLEKTLSISLDDVKMLGTLKTKRTHVPYQAGMLFLDHSVYLNTEDFEVEIEGPSLKEVDNWLNEVLTTYNIPYRTTPNKIKRFFTKKQEIQ